MERFINQADLHRFTASHITGREDERTKNKTKGKTQKQCRLAVGFLVPGKIELRKDAGLLH